MGLSSLSSVNVFVVDGEVVAVDAVCHVHGDISSAHGSANGGHVGSVAGDSRRCDTVVGVVIDVFGMGLSSLSTVRVFVVDGEVVAVDAVNYVHGDISSAHGAAYACLVRSVTSDSWRSYTVVGVIVDAFSVSSGSRGAIRVFIVDGEGVTVDAVSDIHGDIGSAHGAANHFLVGSVTSDSWRSYTVSSIVVDSLGVGWCGLSAVSVLVVNGEVIAVDAISDIHGDIFSSHGSANGCHIGSVTSDSWRSYTVVGIIVEAFSVRSGSRGTISVFVVNGEVVAVDAVNYVHGDIGSAHGSAYACLISSVAGDFGRSNRVISIVVNAFGVSSGSRGTISVLVVNGEGVTVDAVCDIHGDISSAHGSAYACLVRSVAGDFGRSNIVISIVVDSLGVGWCSLSAISVFVVDSEGVAVDAVRDIHGDISSAHGAANHFLVGSVTSDSWRSYTVVGVIVDAFSVSSGSRGAIRVFIVDGEGVTVDAVSDIHGDISSAHGAAYACLVRSVTCDCGRSYIVSSVVVDSLGVGWCSLSAISVFVVDGEVVTIDAVCYVHGDIGSAHGSAYACLVRSVAGDFGRSNIVISIVVDSLGVGWCSLSSISIFVVDSEGVAVDAVRDIHGDISSAHGAANHFLVGSVTSDSWRSYTVVGVIVDAFSVSSGSRGAIRVFIVDGEGVTVDAVSDIHSDIGSAHGTANGSHIGSITCDGRRCNTVSGVVVDAFGMGFSSRGTIRVLVVDVEVVAVDAVSDIHSDIGSSHGAANGSHIGSVTGDSR